MKVDGINAAELSSQYYYLDQTGLSAYFTPDVLNDNKTPRGADKTGKKDWRAQDLQYMLDKLHLGANKYMIIRLLKRGDIVSLLHLLDKNKLVEAMNLFPRSKLIQFINFLPKELVMKMLLWAIPLKQFLQCFPTETIFNILRSKRMEVNDFVRGFENMSVDQLQKLMEHITGRNTEKMSQPELLKMFSQLGKEQILEGMKKMPEKELSEFIFQQVKKDPELLMMIPRGDMMKVVSMMPKPNLVELFRMVDENMLVEFLSQLPDKFLAEAVSSMDDNAFGAMLISQYPDLVASLASAA